MDVAAAAFALGHACPGGYDCGLMYGTYPFGAGRFCLNTLAILENVGNHPAADRLLLNMIRHASDLTTGKATPPPKDFEDLMKLIGYQ